MRNKPKVTKNNGPFLLGLLLVGYANILWKFVKYINS